jgi:hypothetical protein
VKGVRGRQPEEASKLPDSIGNLRSGELEEGDRADTGSMGETGRLSLGFLTTSLPRNKLLYSKMFLK